MNRYIYSLNNPVNYLDPNGREPVTLLVVLAIGVIVAAGAGIGFYIGYKLSDGDIATAMLWALGGALLGAAAATGLFFGATPFIAGLKAITGLVVSMGTMVARLSVQLYVQLTTWMLLNPASFFFVVDVMGDTLTYLLFTERDQWSLGGYAEWMVFGLAVNGAHFAFSGLRMRHQGGSAITQQAMEEVAKANRAAMRERVLNNIAASRAGRQASNFKTYAQAERIIGNVLATRAGTKSSNFVVHAATEYLLGFAKQADQARPGQGAVPGTRKHTFFGNLVRQQGSISNTHTFGVEESWLLGSRRRGSPRGSVRLDAVLKDRNGNIVAIFDLKTGSASLKPARIARIRSHLSTNNLPTPTKVPVIEIRP